MLRKIDNYTFVCNSRNTRSGFAHDCTLYKNDLEIENASCHYLNRTWECYQYQTVMLKTIRKVMETIENNCLFVFKKQHGYNKMTEKRKEEFVKYLETNEEYEELNKVYDELRKSHC